MLHGNPTWSFMYRNLILALRDRFRCIAPDHVGCGLSDKPDDGRYDYSLGRRIADLTTLLDHLHIDRDVTLVLHDWGGMIGMAWATRFPGRIKRLIVLNTAAFPMPPEAKLPRSLWWARNTGLGALLIRGANAFCRLTARWGVTTPLPADVRRMYLGPYDSWGNRIAVLRFVQTIPLSNSDVGYDIVRDTGERLSLLRDKPALICWGMHDFVFDEHFLNEWQRRLPAAETYCFADAGHYLLEDAGEQVIERIEEFLLRT
jgi:cis-3-alkyl-4-acyloxetan-2-one decarboxylase